MTVRDIRTKKTILSVGDHLISTYPSTFKQNICVEIVRVGIERDRLVVGLTPTKARKLAGALVELADMAEERKLK